nr:hypothetical protein [uncultured Desulfobacter sp.]
MTNKDRIKYLRAKIEILSLEIQNENLENSFIEYLKKISEGEQKLKEINDDSWEIMLPAERKEHLFSYFQTLRLELNEMMKELNENNKPGWLENKWVKKTITIAGLIQFATIIYQAGNYMGLYYHEEDKKNKY